MKIERARNAARKEIWNQLTGSMDNSYMPSKNFMYSTEVRCCKDSESVLIPKLYII